MLGRLAQTAQVFHAPTDADMESYRSEASSVLSGLGIQLGVTLPRRMPMPVEYLLLATVAMHGKPAVAPQNKPLTPPSSTNSFIPKRRCTKTHVESLTPNPSTIIADVEAKTDLKEACGALALPCIARVGSCVQGFISTTLEGHLSANHRYLALQPGSLSCNITIDCFTFSETLNSNPHN